MRLLYKGLMSSGYAQVKISVSPELASAFKDLCSANNTSVAGELSRFMEKQAGFPGNPRTPLSTRRQRRSELREIIVRLAAVIENERTYMDNIPENLQESSVFEIAAQSVESREEALDILDSAYG